ncbi:MAG: tRNA (adenosine(37)-N6)-dimethylallyltransferase MiaA [Bacillota bacterium]
MNNLPQEQGIPLLVLVGPTAVGKTALSIELAKRLDAEIVSADSVQVYRGLNIGTAKPTLEEQCSVKHHLIDIVDPTVNFTVYDYQRLARKTIAEIHNLGRLPLLVGGTGLYIKAVLEGFIFSSGKSSELIRKRLQDELKLKGKENLYRMLQEQDPASAGVIHPNDTKRVLRALEFFYLTGEPISVQKKRTRDKESSYKPLLIGLYMPREHLYARINKRVDMMMQSGFLAEVRGLLQKGYDKNLKSLQSLGYRHMITYLEGEWDWETTLFHLKRDTRRYAKRQLTWFCADPRIRWFPLRPGDNFNRVLESICCQLAGY